LKDAMIRGTPPVDLVIVGAGAAGLAAARTARDLGLEFVLFEAMDRVGGRAFTDLHTFGVPWDRGCHWLHSADINPFTRLADDYGFRYRAEATPWEICLDGRHLAADEAGPPTEFYESSAAATLTVGQHGEDIAIAAVVDLDNPWLWLLRLGVAAEWGMDLDSVSTLDVARYRDTGQNWPVADGYGALVARHAAGLPVELATPVERIEWSGNGVRVDTPRGSVAAAAAVVTVSTGVLAADALVFDPPLPVWKQEAIAATPLGSANKVAFRVPGDRLGVAGHTNVAIRYGESGISFQLRPFGWDLASAYVAGPLGAELEREGAAAMIDAALQALTGIVGNDVARHVQASACVSWGKEATIRGAYAAARPGEAHRRGDLARPLADRLYFAGEATSPDFFTTCHGAHLSGIAAVEAVAGAIAGR
jgi:monoamine oxidase